MGSKLSSKKKRSILIFMALLSFLCGVACCSYAFSDVPQIIWLDFKLPPHYDKERKEIMGVTRQKYPDDLKKWSKVKNFNFDAMAVADLDGDGQPDVAFVVIEIVKNMDDFISAGFAKFVRRKGQWTYSTDVVSTGEAADREGKRLRAYPMELVDRVMRLDDCIQCLCCMAVCPAYKKEPRMFVGPMGLLALAAGSEQHPDRDFSEMVSLCIDCGRCEKVCPRRIPLYNEAIKTLKGNGAK